MTTKEMEPLQTFAAVVENVDIDGGDGCCCCCCCRPLEWESLSGAGSTATDDCRKGEA